MNKKKTYGLSGMALKVIAMLTMLIDHVGYVLFPMQLVFRYIGRIAFPLYCFLLVEGFFHTRNRGNYIARMALFAILSEVPFNLAFHRTVIYRAGTNVFFTLLIGLLVMYICQMIYQRTKDHTFGAIVCFTGMLAANAISCDYSYMGVLMIYIFYIGWEGTRYGTKKDRINTKMLMILMEALVIILYPGSIENYALIALVLIWLYSGKKTGALWKRWQLQRGEAFIKYFFYAFYPLHLMVLYVLGS